MLSPRLRWKLERARERLQGFFAELFRPERKPRLCFNCGRLVGSEESTCSHCGARQSALSLAALKRVGLAAIPAENPVTYTLLFANFLLFVVAWTATLRVAEGPMSLFGAMNGQVMLLLGAKQGLLVFAGQLWRLVMANFLHWDLLHIGFNSLALWQVGPQVEEMYGSRRYLFIYLATGVAGFVASTLWNPLSISAGASASILGLIGVLISRLAPQPGFQRAYRSQLIRWVVIILVLGLFLPFDNAGHVGGLVAGLVLGRVVSDRRPATAGARLRVALMTWSAVIALLWSVGMVLLNLPGAC